jgi:Mg-chelatase subunit ChlI
VCVCLCVFVCVCVTAVAELHCHVSQVRSHLASLRHAACSSGASAARGCAESAMPSLSRAAALLPALTVTLTTATSTHCDDQTQTQTPTKIQEGGSHSGGEANAQAQKETDIPTTQTQTQTESETATETARASEGERVSSMVQKMPAACQMRPKFSSVHVESDDASECQVMCRGEAAGSAAPAGS